jgi:glyoxylase-like metal-dependent hydrolase (beta-lactamase superfamily II)
MRQNITPSLHPTACRAWRSGPVAWVTGLAMLLGCLQAFAQGTTAVKALPVAEGTWYVQGVGALGSSANRNFISNAGFVITPDGVLVVDALGSPALADELMAEIRRLTPLPVRYLVVTHCHADHIYGLQVFRAAGARIVGHVGCRDYLTSDTARRRLEASREDLFPWIDERTQLVAPDVWVGDGPDGPDAGMMLRLGDRTFELRHAGPAHTTEDLLVHDPHTGVLFAGDIVFRGRIPFVGQADSGHWIQALDRMVAWNPRVLVPGHGPLSIDPRADLQLTRDYLAYLRQAMGEAARQLEPFEEAYARTDWSRFAHLPLFAAANRMNAFNTYLLMERMAP